MRVKSNTTKLKDFRFSGFRTYTTLAMLTFLYCFIVKSKITSAISLPPVGIEPGTRKKMTTIGGHQLSLLIAYFTNLDITTENIMKSLVESTCK